MAEGRSYVMRFGASTKGFEDGIDRMTSKLREYQKELRNNKKEQKEASSEIKAAEKELKALEKEIQKSGEATEQQKKRQEELNKVIKDASDRLEALKVKQAGLQKEIDNTKKSISDQKKAMEEYKKALDGAKKNAVELAKEVGGLAAAGTAALAALFAYSKGAAQWADDLNTMSKVTGISTAELQKMQYAADLVDVSAETMSGSLTKLTRNMSTALNSETSSAAQAFRELRIEIDDGTGHLRDRQEVFAEAIDALGKIGNETERDATAMTLFGKSAQELNPLIEGGAKKLKSLGDQAERAGLILSQDELDRLNTFNDRVDLLKAKGSQIEKLAAGELTPALDGLIDVADELIGEINEMVQSGELEEFAEGIGEHIRAGAKDLKNLISFVIQHKEAVAGATAAMVGWKVGLSVGSLVNNLVVAIKAAKIATDEETGSQIALNTAMNANPIGIVIGLLGAFATAIGTVSVMSAAAAGEIDDLDRSYQNYLQSLQDAEAQAREKESRTESEISTIRALESAYDKLTGTTERTTEEKNKLSKVAAELASALGVSSDELKDKEGNYISITGKINDYIEKLREQIQLESNKEGLTAAYKSYNEASEGYAKAKKELDEYIEKNRELGDLRNSVKGSSIYDPLFDEYDSRMSVLTGAVDEYRFQVVQAAGAVGEYEEKMGSASSALEREGELIDEAINGAGQLTGQINDLGSAQDDLVKKTTSSGSAFDSASEEVEKYVKALAAGEDGYTLEGFYALFEKTEEGAEAAEDALKEANRALEENKTAIRTAKEEAEKARKALSKLDEGTDEYNAQKNDLEELIGTIADLETEQTRLRKNVTDAKTAYEQAAWSAKTYGERMAEITKAAAPLRADLKSLAETYQSLQQGQQLSLDALIQLAEKYPDYTIELIGATGNIDSQRTAVEALYEAKKQELILTLQKARDEISASNDETRTKLTNASKQIAAIQAQASAGALWAKTSQDYIKGLKATVDDLTRSLDEGINKFNNYNNAIAELQGTSIGNYSTGSSGAGSGSSGGSGSGGGGGSGSGGGSAGTSAATVWTTRSKPGSGEIEVGTGSTKVESMVNWAERVYNLGKGDDKWLREYYDKILAEEQMTADESYNIRLRRKNLNDKIQNDEVRAAEEAERKVTEAQKKEQEGRDKALKASAEATQKRREQASAAYEKLIKGETEALEKENEKIQKNADAQIAAIDKELEQRRRKKEDDSRSDELKAIEQQLKYGRLDDQSRAELERKKQDILNEQYDADFERDAEKRKTEIQNEANKQMDKNTSAMNDLSVSLDNFAYAISKASGTLTAQQIVNHNTKNQNIKVIQQAGLSKKQTDAFLAAIFDG